jgi:hypothetical protein
MKVQFIAVSQNAKTGPIPASIVERATCWPGCALHENGCYAEAGALALHWDRVSRDLAGGSWSEFCAKVAALRPGRLWRYAQAGDLPGYGAEIDGTLLKELVAANTDKNVIAFTHKPVLGDDPVVVQNRRLIIAAIYAGFTINLSADNTALADKLAELGIAPVARACPRLCASGSSAPAQETARSVGRNDRRLARPHGVVAAVYARWTANSDLPGDVFRCNLQELRCLRPSSGCRDRIPGSWRLATSRGRDGCPRCPGRRKLGLREPSYDGRGDRRRNSLAYNPCQQ